MCNSKTELILNNAPIISLVIPDEITEIKNYVFPNCKSITSLTIPNAVKSIGKQAFCGCTGITNISIPNSVTSIGEGAFKECTKLTTISIPNSLEKIEKEVFRGCLSLTDVSIPNSITFIDDYAFEGCSVLKSISLSNSLATIGERAFQYCSELTSITVPSSLKLIGGYAFCGCDKLKTVHISDLHSWLSINFNDYDSNPCNNGATLYLNGVELNNITIPSDLTEIKPYAFDGCSSITSINISTSVTTIGDKAFRGCDKLKNVYISDLLSWLSVDFKNYGNPCCNGATLYLNSVELKNITIPSEITEIKPYAFDGCSCLTSINIPTSVTAIGDDAFRGCQNLKNITIPNSVTSIGNYTFNGCNNLSGTLSLPETITSIGKEAFNGTCYEVCHIKASTPPTITSKTFGSAMKVVIVPDNYVDSYNSAEIWSDYKIIAESQNRVIDVTVSTPGMLASDIVNQAEIAPKNVTKLVVHGAINETDFKVMKSNMTSCYSIDLSDADCTEIPNDAFRDKDYLMDFKLPIKCTSIGNYAFCGCNVLSSIDFPESLTTIGYSAFQNCTNIKKADFGKTSLETINSTVFVDCTSLQEITLSGTIKDIKWAAFSGCTNLSKIRIGWPSSLRLIEGRAFMNCRSLPGLNLSECPELTTIAEEAFRRCSGMKSLNLSGCTKLTSIGSYAFSECINIPKVDLSACKAITSIGSYAFNGCSSMTTLNLPTSLTSVEGYAFQNCTALKNITVPCVTPPAAGVGAFSGVDNNTCALSMPTQSYIDYLTAEHWGAFVEMRKWIEVTEVNGAKDTYGNDMGHIYFSRGNVSVSGNQEAKAEPYVLTSTAALGMTGIDAVTDDGMSLYVQANDVVSFAFVPEAGCTLERVYYGGTDVTNQVVNGVFTTPAVSAQTTIRVEFSDGSSTGIEQATQVPFRVYIDGGKIKIEGLKAHTPIQLFTIDGQRVYQGTDSLITPPARGIYMVHAAGHTVKIAL